ncbi:MFS transporter [Nocardia sputorum]|uniref:MFS transporter n=2 Tax=Nocardia sputorum TaxID=2984338 RepID=A0ABN6U5X9_9NOCA|nr:MFS transporter [Nocardia sputorum]
MVAAEASVVGINPQQEVSGSGARIVAVLAACGILMSLQQTMILPLLPALPALLHTTAGTASWLVTATLLSGAVVTPLIGRLADMYGKKRLILVTLAVVVAASLLGALSDALVPLVIARAAQGCGLSLIPVAVATMRDVLPPHRIPGAVATMSASLAIGAAAGLPLSGLIVTFLDWHCIFWVMVLSGALLATAVATVIPTPPPAHPVRGGFDYFGALLLAAALTALLLPLSKGSQWGWTTARTLLFAGTGVLLFGLWVPLQLRSTKPLVNLRVTTRPPVLLVNACALLIGFALFSNILLTTQMLQLPVATGFGAGMSALQAGWSLMPIALVGIIVAPLAGRAIARFGASSVLLVAAAELALAFAVRVPFSSEPWHLLAGAVVVGAGLSFTIAAIPTSIMTMAPITESASATTIGALLQSVGTSTASATMAATATTWNVTIDGHTYPSLTAFTAMFWISAGTTLTAAVLALALVVGGRLTVGGVSAPPTAR